MNDSILFDNTLADNEHCMGPFPHQWHVYTMETYTFNKKNESLVPLEHPILKLICLNCKVKKEIEL